MTTDHVLLIFFAWIILSNGITAMRNPADGWYPWFFRFLYGVMQVVKTEIAKNPQFSTLAQTVDEPGKTTTTVAETSILPPVKENP